MTASFAGNTAGATVTQFTGNLVFAGGTNITLSNATNSLGQTVSIVGAVGGGAGFTGGVSNIGNTSGDTGTVSNRIILAGGNNVTLSQSTDAGGATITISGAAGGGGSYNILSAGTQVANTSGTVKFQNGNGVSFGMSNNSVITGSVAAQTNPTIYSTVIGNDRGWAQASISLGQNSLYIFPHILQQVPSGTCIKVPLMVTNSSSAFAAHTRGYTAEFAVYSRVGSNSTVLTRDFSTNYTASFSANSNVSWNIGVITGCSGGTSYVSQTASSAGINLSSSIHGARELIFGFPNKLTAGEYWWAFRHSSSSAGAAGNLFNVSHLIASSQTQNRMGVVINATNTGIAKNIGLGTYSATTGAMPAAISMTQINQAATNPIFYWVADTV